MTTVYYDSPMNDDERRQRLYKGDIFVFSPRASTLALTEFARELIEDAFGTLDPRDAQFTLPVETFVSIVAPLKPRFIHHPRTTALVLDTLRDLHVDLDRTYFDVPRMRVATSDGYLNAGVAYPLHPHRDIWYSSPPCQLNWWLPVYPFASESSFAFHPRYWNEPVPNGSGDYNHYDWNRDGRANAAAQIKADTRKQPKPLGPLDLEPELRLVCDPGGLILFSGAHLHSTVANTSGHTRFSIDMRTAHVAELASVGGAPTIDRDCTGTTLFELRRASDFAPVPEDIIRLYDPNPPVNREGLVYQPPVSAVGM